MEAIATRLRMIREMRGYTQVEVAKKAGIHVVLYRQYEGGTKNPKEEQLDKIAKALLVDINMLRIPKAEKGDEILAYLYELINCHGDVSIIKENDAFNIRIPIAVCDAEMKTHLREAAEACAKLSEDEFKLWLLNYRYHRVRTLDCSTGCLPSRYPALEVTHADDAESDNT